MCFRSRGKKSLLECKREYRIKDSATLRNGTMTKVTPSLKPSPNRFERGRLSCPEDSANVAKPRQTHSSNKNTTPNIATYPPKNSYVPRASTTQPMHSPILKTRQIATTHTHQPQIPPYNKRSHIIPNPQFRSVKHSFMSEAHAQRTDPALVADGRFPSK